jgi:hypothetical protein
MASESIAKLLGDSAEVRPLTERLAHVKRLNRRYRSLVPEGLAEASRVCAMDGTTVVICAASSAVAAALRHLAPRLLEGLRGVRSHPKSSRDQELTSVRIEVQVVVKPPPRKVVARSEMPREKLKALAQRLGDSPLKDALAQIGEEPSATRKSRTKP